MIKNNLRKELIKKRDNIKEIDLKSIAICKKLCKEDYYKNANAIMVYSPIKSEVKTDFLIKEMALMGKTAVYPVCLEYNIVPSTCENGFQIGTYGILEPVAPVPYPIEKIDLVIVPGLAFDKSGNRIGYGKGYYDRFLANYKGLKIGLCFSEMLEETLPTEPYDVKVDKVIIDMMIR